MRTFREFSSVELTGFELYCDDVAEGFVKELYWDSQSAHDGVVLSGNWDSIRRVCEPSDRGLMSNVDGWVGPSARSVGRGA